MLVIFILFRLCESISSIEEVNECYYNKILEMYKANCRWSRQYNLTQVNEIRNWIDEEYFQKVYFYEFNAMVGDIELEWTTQIRSDAVYFLPEEDDIHYEYLKGIVYKIRDMPYLSSYDSGVYGVHGCKFLKRWIIENDIAWNNYWAIPNEVRFWYARDIDWIGYVQWCDLTF